MMGSPHGAACLISLALMVAGITLGGSPATANSPALPSIGPTSPTIATPADAAPAPAPTRTGGGVTVGDDTRPAVVVDAITTPVRTIRVVKGRSVSLPVIVRGTFPTDSEVVTWRTSNDHVAITPPSPIMVGPTDGSFRAKLNSSAVVRIKGSALGTSTLKLAAPGGAGVSVKVRVVTTAVKVKEVTIAKKETKLALGAVAVLGATVSPGTATGAIIRWTSSKPKIATIDADGQLVAHAVGRTVVTAQAGSKKARFTLTVA
jgi:hypothetical protein